MDINYNTILEYLCSENIENNDNINFPTKKNIMVSSENFPEIIASHLGKSKETFYRYGITRYDNNHTNVSFLSSILTLVDKKFISLDTDEENSYIKSYLKQIRDIIKKPSFKFELNSKFSKDILLDRLDNLRFEDGILMQVFCQILDLNILIMDFKSEKIYSLFNGDFLNPWKVTLLLAKNDSDWEPIFCDKKQFSFNDQFIKTILTNEEILYYNENFLDKSYSLLDNIEQIETYQNDEQDEENSNSEVSDEIDDTFINPSNEVKNLALNKTKLKNMRKDEILELLLKLNVNVDKTAVKSKMIEELLPYI